MKNTAHVAVKLTNKLSKGLKSKNDCRQLEDKAAHLDIYRSNSESKCYSNNHVEPTTEKGGEEGCFLVMFPICGRFVLYFNFFYL